MNFIVKTISYAAFLALILFTRPLFAEVFQVNREDDPIPMAAPNGCNTGGSCSLREAVLAANASLDDDLIELPAGTYTLSIPESDGFLAETGDLDIVSFLETGDSLTMQGAGVNTTVIQGLQPELNDRLLEIFSSSGLVTISDLTLRGGHHPVLGGAIHANRETHLQLSNCRMTENTSDNIGGALFSESEEVQISNCSVDHNTAKRRGGGIFVMGTGTSLNIQDSVFSQNRLLENPAAESIDGAAVYYTSWGDVTIENSRFQENVIETTGYGSAITLNGERGINAGHVLLKNVTITDNRIQGDGSGALNASIFSTFTMEDSRITDNVIEQSGGSAGLSVQADELTLLRTLIDGNRSLGTQRFSFGGGGFLQGNDVLLREVEVSNNSINNGGGGGLMIFGRLLATDSRVLIDRSTIHHNSALNDAGGDGGGLYLGMADFQIVNSTISNNRTNNSAGGIFSNDAPLALYNVTVAENRAGSESNPLQQCCGGILQAGVTPAALHNSIIARNSVSGISPASSAPDCFGTYNSNGHNLIGSRNGCNLQSTGPLDLVGVDPRLSPLASHGGLTPTHALLVGSLAFNAGDPNGCRDSLGSLLDVDQREFLRPVGPRCDIGAFESPELSSAFADLSIEKTSIFDVVQVGEAVTYKILVENLGPDAAQFIRVLDQAPSQLTILHADSPVASCTFSDRQVICEAAALGVGETLEIEIMARVEQSGMISNVASVSSQDNDTDFGNNESTVVITGSESPTATPTPEPTPSSSPTPSPLPEATPPTSPTPAQPGTGAPAIPSDVRGGGGCSLVKDPRPL